jgi:hypothetical protein
LRISAGRQQAFLAPHRGCLGYRLGRAGAVELGCQTFLDGRWHFGGSRRQLVRLDALAREGGGVLAQTHRVRPCRHHVHALSDR